MCYKENKLKDILKQICQENPDKYKMLLESLENNAKTIEPSIEPLEDKNIEAVYESVKDKGAFVEMTDTIISTGYLGNTSKIQNQFDFVTEKDIKYAIEIGTGKIVNKEDKDPKKKYIEDLSPVCTGIINPTDYPDLACLIAMFNCGESSNRIFNYIHYPTDKDKHLTISFIHSAKPPSILKYLVEETKIVDYIISRLPEYKMLIEKDDYLVSIAKANGIDFNNNDNLKTAITKFFTKLGDNDQYANEWAIYTDRKGKGEDWFRPIMKDALLLKDVCVYQTKKWIENNPLGDAKNKARKYFLSNHYGLVAALASIRSSRHGARGVEEALQEARSNQIDSEYKNKPENDISIWLKENKADEIALEVFLWYNRKDGSSRSRQKAIYEKWFVKTWGTYDPGKKQFNEYKKTNEPMSKSNKEVFKYK